MFRRHTAILVLSTILLVNSSLEVNAQQDQQPTRPIERRFTKKTIVGTGVVTGEGVTPAMEKILWGHALYYFSQNDRINAIYLRQETRNAIRNAYAKEKAALNDVVVNNASFANNGIITLIERAGVSEITNRLALNAEARAKNILSEEDLMRFAVEKAKGSGVTAEQIIKLMNTGYLFHIHQLGAKALVQKNKNEDLPIFYFRAQLLVFKVETQDAERATITYRNDLSFVYEFGVPFKTLQDAEARGYAQGANVWAKRAAQSLKMEDLFKANTFVESIKGDEFTARITDGKIAVSPNDGYDILEEVMNEEGNVEMKRAGFSRVKSISEKNDGVMTFKRYFGKVDQGMLLIEQNLSASTGLSITHGVLNINALNTRDENTRNRNNQWITADIQSYWMANFMFSQYNKEGDFFGTYSLEAIISYGQLDIPSGENSKGVGSLIFSFYANLQKRVYLGAHYLEAGAAVGIDYFGLSHSNSPNTIKSVSALTPSLKPNISLFMGFSPTIHLFLRAEYALRSSFGLQQDFNNEREPRVLTDIPNSLSGFGIHLGVRFSFYNDLRSYNIKSNSMNEEQVIRYYDSN